VTLETTYTGIGAVEPDAPDDGGRRHHDNLWRPWWAHSGIWVLLTLAVLVVVGVVLSSSAGAAGGCGGG
jgi:hypothetical protein